MKKLLLLLLLFSSGATGFGQEGYRYALDLNKVENDRLRVVLETPAITSKTTVYAFPKIIPGTYSISDYGKFIEDLKAFDGQGKPLKVQRMNDNQWKISKANKLKKITYLVDDIFDTNKEHNVYPMAATNIEEKKNIVVNTPGFFGYFDGINKLPVEVSFEKPSGFYASTPLNPVTTSATTDVFKVGNIDELYDSPFMYTIPDTATVKVGNCNVLVSVYSPNKVLHAKEIAGWLGNLLNAAKSYLGGKLPADKYAFLYYFNPTTNKHAFKPGLGGALEHNTSSFYYLPEMPASQLKNTIVDVSSHEFFHIITPLTISSREVKEFNYNQAVLSKHLWLYEGSTEYSSHLVQVKYSLNSVPEFLEKLSDKITASRTQYNDSLSFTGMSKLAATTYANQYNNVYQKGALISACLDILLLHLSEGNYGLKNLTYDLGVRYGKKRYFNDEELF